MSYEEQLEAGYKHPGSAGLTSDRMGDARWSPSQEVLGTCWMSCHFSVSRVLYYRGFLAFSFVIGDIFNEIAVA